MKRLIILFGAVLNSVAVMAAGGVMVVDSEQIFKSIAEYNAALSEIENLSKVYQQQVDEKFAQVEAAFNTYAAERGALTAAQRSDREAMILRQERSATEFQQSHFSNDGSLMKRRMELITPIQERVFRAVEEFAQAAGYDVVIDKASSSTLLYSNPAANKTDEIIEKLK